MNIEKNHHSNASPTPLFLLMLMAITSHVAYAGDGAAPKPIFKLTQGQGTEVCEAYLQRLQATEFLNNDPTQGRLNEPLLKGFADLKPVPLTRQEIQHLYPKIHSFEHAQDQDLMDNTIARLPNGREREMLARHREWLLKTIDRYMQATASTPFVRYQIKLDLDNNGIYSDTVVKNNNSIYLVNWDLRRLDQEKMLVLLADPEILRWPSITSFPPIAAPLTVFGYRDRFYVDGFQNICLEGWASALCNFNPPMVFNTFAKRIG